MTQIPSTPQSITIELTHDVVEFGEYKLRHWEAARRAPVQCHLNVGVGSGLASVLNINVELAWEYYFNGSAVIMNSPIDSLVIPSVTSLNPAKIDFSTSPYYPGLARIRLVATAGGQAITIHSNQGVTGEFSRWFYVIEREAAILIALTLAKETRS